MDVSLLLFFQILSLLRRAREKTKETMTNLTHKNSHERLEETLDRSLQNAIAGQVSEILPFAEMILDVSAF
jgi:hypothetical protein